MKTIELTFTQKPKLFDGVFLQKGIQEFDFVQKPHHIDLTFETDLTPGSVVETFYRLLENGDRRITETADIRRTE